MNETITVLLKKIEHDYWYVVFASATLVIFSNLLVVVSSVILVRKGQQPRCTYLLLGNISLADLIIGQMTMLGLMYNPSYTEDTVLLCIICLGIYVTCAVTSLISVLLIAIDRYLYIVQGLKYKMLIYPKKIKTMIIGAWILGILLGIVPLFIWRQPADKIVTCWYTIVATPNMLITTSMIGITIISIIIILYAHILYVALRKVIQIRKMMKGNTTHNAYTLRFFKGSYGNSSENGQLSRNSDSTTTFNRESNSSTQCTADNDRCYIINTRRYYLKSVAPNKWKAFKIVAFVTGSVAVTWLPYLITSLMFALCDFERDPLGCESFQMLVISPTAILACINSFLNPIIYAWWHTGFRAAFIKLFLKKI